MTLAVVKTHLGEKEIIATLTETAWSVPDAPVLVRILNMETEPGRFGPQCSDPVTAAANHAAVLLAGAVTYVAEPEPTPSGAIF
jgi:hypothetical protein